MKWLLLVVLVPVLGMAATLSPENVVELDLRWLSPPTVTPQNGLAAAEMRDGYTRLRADFTAEGATFAWPLRYAVVARHYPIVVLRYRARNLIPGPEPRLLVMNLTNPAGQTTPAIILDVNEIVQDGVVREIRKDLSRFAADNAIDSIRFSFNAPAGGGHLDIFELRFEQGPGSPAPLALPRETVSFVVTDTAGRAVPDAEVRVGLIERSNWSTMATTDGAGRVNVPVIRPVRPTGEAVDPVEAMVVKQGFVPHYVAPIGFPRGGPVDVKLTPVEQQTSSAPAQATPIGQEPERVVYLPQQPTVIYETSPTVVYVERYAPAWWVPVHYVGYHPYPYHHSYLHVGATFRRDDRRDDRHDGRHDVRHDDRRDDFRSGRDDGSLYRPTPPQRFPTPGATPREEARQRIIREVDRGNEPAAGYRDSELYRRSEAAGRPAPAPPPRQVAPPPAPAPTPVPDRGDRYGEQSRGGFERRVEPAPAPTRMPERPRESMPQREAPRPAPSRSEVERGNEPPAGGGGGGGDRGSRYSR